MFLLDFCFLISTQFRVKIKSIRSDNAPELALSNFFCAHRVVSFHLCVETLHQNSVVERKHQHILNVARALFFQSKLPLVHWTDCIVTVVHLINRTPSPFLFHKTPFVLLWHKKPSYSHLKAFGCLCFTSTLSCNRTKFSPHATPCVFRGYPLGYKGYKLLDLSTNTVFISCDVIFHESTFPLSSSPSPTSTTDIFSGYCSSYFFTSFSYFHFHS